MKVAIIGAGASGLACAIEAFEEAKRSGVRIDITLFEKNDRAGKKILATGNGRCNLTNLNCKKDFYNGGSDVAVSVFQKFSPESNIEFFKRLGLYTRADSEGRVYPLSNQASSVLDALRLGIRNRGIKIVTDFPVKSIEHKDGFYLVDGKRFDKIVLAAGGKACVKDFNGYELLRGLDIPVTKTAPSLVRLTTEDKTTKSLKGIRAAVRLTLKIDGKVKAEEKGELLFSDNVLSGIAAMQLSAYISRHFTKSKTRPFVDVDFVPDFSYDELLREIKLICKSCKDTESENILSAFMPKKIGMAILKKSSVPFDKRAGDLNEAETEKIVSFAKRYTFEISGTKDYADAQVTSGGADLTAFNTETLESEKHKGFYCCGEILDIDGLCGGYNLQWAWSSGRLVGQSLVKG